MQSDHACIIVSPLESWHQKIEPCSLEENLLYIHHLDDPWTAANDAGFREFYDLSTDPYELRNLVYYGEVPLTDLQTRLQALKGCAGNDCRTMS